MIRASELIQIAVMPSAIRQTTVSEQRRQEMSNKFFEVVVEVEVAEDGIYKVSSQTDGKPLPMFFIGRDSLAAALDDDKFLDVIDTTPFPVDLMMYFTGQRHGLTFALDVLEKSIVICVVEYTMREVSGSEALYTLCTENDIPIWDFGVARFAANTIEDGYDYFHESMKVPGFDTIYGHESAGVLAMSKCDLPEKWTIINYIAGTKSWIARDYRDYAVISNDDGEQILIPDDSAGEMSHCADEDNNVSVIDMDDIVRFEVDKFATALD